MNGFSRDFVYRCFSDFYSSPYTAIPSLASLDQRELGFLLFKEQIMLRHQGFSQIDDLKIFLRKRVPSDVYRSCAYYENPAAGMDNKGWLGADLVFDIDADHIPTECDKLHDEWTCKDCGLLEKGEPPKKCTKCGGERFSTKTWPCEKCLSSAKSETSKLINILQEDFGFSDREMHVFFSGHRGYHIHVENEAVKPLDSMSRKEIVDYVTGLGLNIAHYYRKDRKGKKTGKFFLTDFAWSKRIKQGMQNFISTATPTDLQNVGLGKKVSAAIFSKKELISRSITKGLWESVPGISSGTWRKIADYVKDNASSNIDTVVTTDTHRLIRMNGTLHGKTGLRKLEFPLTGLDDFDPFKEAVAFKEGTVKVFVSDVPKFRVGETVFGPYKRQTVELPTAAAVMIVCKDRAEVSN